MVNEGPLAEFSFGGPTWAVKVLPGPNPSSVYDKCLLGAYSSILNTFIFKQYYEQCHLLSDSTSKNKQLLKNTCFKD